MLSGGCCSVGIGGSIIEQRNLQCIYSRIVLSNVVDLKFAQGMDERVQRAVCNSAEQYESVRVKPRSRAMQADLYEVTIDHARSTNPDCLGLYNSADLVRRHILETGLGRASDRIRTRREWFFEVDLFCFFKLNRP